jgi:hypothetical protein
MPVENAFIFYLLNSDADLIIAKCKFQLNLYRCGVSESFIAPVN